MFNTINTTLQLKPRSNRLLQALLDLLHHRRQVKPRHPLQVLALHRHLLLGAHQVLVATMP